MPTIYKELRELREATTYKVRLTLDNSLGVATLFQNLETRRMFGMSEQRCR